LPKKLIFFNLNQMIKSIIKLNFIRIIILYGIIIFPFLLTRLQFFLYYPFVITYPDSFTYLGIVDNLNESILPILDTRSIGYPLFLWIIYTIAKSNIAIIVVQNLIHLGTCLWLNYELAKTFPKIRYYLAIALSLFINSPEILIVDNSLLTESIYISNYFLLVIFLLKVLSAPERRLWWVLLSITLVFQILIKPMALYLLVAGVIFLSLGYLYRYPIKNLLLSLGIVVGLLLGYSTYNYLVGGFFGLTAFGQANFMGTVMGYIEPRDEYQPCVNQAINDISQKTKIVHQIINNSTDLNILYKNYARIYNYTHHFFHAVQNYCFDKERISMVKYNQIVNSIISDAITTHPDLYGKFVLSNLYYYFFKNHMYGMNFNKKLVLCYEREIHLKEAKSDSKLPKLWEAGRNQDIENRIQILSQNLEYRIHNVKSCDTLIVTPQMNIDILQHFVQVDTVITAKRGGGISSHMRLSGAYPNNFVKLDTGDEFFVQTKRLNTYSLYLWSIVMYVLAHTILNFLLGLNVWVVFLISVYCIWHSRFQVKKPLFFIFMLSLMYIGQAFLVALSEVALLRYSSTLEFIKYFCVIFLWIFYRNYYSKSKSTL